MEREEEDIWLLETLFFWSAFYYLFVFHAFVSGAISNLYQFPFLSLLVLFTFEKIEKEGAELFILKTNYFQLEMVGTYETYI